MKIGILLPKLFWPTVRKNCSSDREKLLKFEAEGRECAKFLRSLKPLQNKKGQKYLGYPRKKQSFYKEKDCFYLGHPKFFGPFLFWSGFNWNNALRFRTCIEMFGRVFQLNMTHFEDTDGKLRLIFLKINW